MDVATAKFPDRARAEGEKKGKREEKTNFPGEEEEAGVWVVVRNERCRGDGGGHRGQRL